jgi:hypothetical protein
MNSTNEFDELARQKLAERSFPLEEGHWLAAQEALHAQRGGSKRGFWFLGAIALLLTGGGAWMLMQDDHEAVPMHTEARSAHGVATLAAVEPDKDETIITTGPVEAARPALASSNSGQSIAGEAIVPTGTTHTNGRPQSNVGEEPATSSTPTIAMSYSVPPVPNNVRSASGSIPIVPAEPGAEEGTNNSEEATAGILIPMNGNVLPVALANAENIPAATEPMPSAAAMPAAASAPSLTTTNDTEPAPEQPTAGNAVLATQAVQSTAEETPTPAANDSAVAPLSEPLFNALLQEPSPWEIGILGGLFSTTSRYSGANSSTWNDGITRQNTPGFAAEAMHMGRHFGFGMGLHYSAYAERIAVEELSTTTVEVDRYWYLAPVQTTILVITDTIEQGGMPYFVGTSLDTTVNVITPGFDTTTTVTQQRAARELSNRTSYLEIPLLLDAHLIQGRWSFGVRGGPTIAVLRSWQGALPNSSNDGYSEFDDQSFNELLIGYTARAYVRYRWNAAWSLGFEPAVRGQLMNSLGEGELQRRSSAFGGMISLSYRLR